MMQVRIRCVKLPAEKGMAVLFSGHCLQLAHAAQNPRRNLLFGFFFLAVRV